MFKFLIRISSFMSKELTEILRQPKLILTLVLGPFLVMFLFGLGYPDQNRTLRTTFVYEDPDSLQEEKLFTDSIPGIADQAEENNKELALAKLALNQTDLVILIPANALETVRNNQQAMFIIYHNEVDPFQIAYINSVARIYTDEDSRMPARCRGTWKMPLQRHKRLNRLFHQEIQIQLRKSATSKKISRLFRSN